MLDPIAFNADLIVVNHSGGKDSQAMTNHLLTLVPREKIVLVHAVLPGVDWEGIEAHIRACHPGLPLYTCIARWKDGSQKTLLGMVEKRGMWPSKQQRYCTSDLKRDPLAVLIRQIARERGAQKILNCEGLRAEESDDRAARNPVELHERLSKAGRLVINWLPIHGWSGLDVFRNIARCGQQPHAAYKAGMTRLSCCFCILATKQDLATAAALKPALKDEIVALEQRIGHTMKSPKKGALVTLADFIADAQRAYSNPLWEQAQAEVAAEEMPLAA